MAKKSKSAHRKNAAKKPFLTKREKKMLLGILAAAAAVLCIFFIYLHITDDSLDVKDGVAITGDGNWLVVKEGTRSNPKYYKYCSYDFSPLDAEIEVDSYEGDTNLANIYIRPTDGAYDYICFYGTDQPSDTLPENVRDQMSRLLGDEAVSPVESVEYNGISARQFTYTTENPVTDDDGNVTTRYSQVFCCYLDTDRDGTVILRLNYTPEDEDSFIDAETAFGYIEDAANCITIYK